MEVYIENYFIGLLELFLVNLDNLKSCDFKNRDASLSHIFNVAIKLFDNMRYVIFLVVFLLKISL